SKTRSSIQPESSSNSGRLFANIWEKFNSINNGTKKHKGASYRYCSLKWSRGRAYKIKSYLTIKYNGKVPKEIQMKVLSDIQTFNNPYFENYTKALNPNYDPPKCTALATSILDSEAANIIIKVDKELSKAKNLILCIE
ncbi:33721_t:CDS:2, partial [Gigaspora margarita]